MPRVRLTRRQITVFAIFMLSAIGFLYFVLPKLTSAGETVHRIEHGDKWWIAIGVVLEVLSFGGYVVLFRTVFVKRPHPSQPPRADQLARHLRDHDGGARGDAAVRRRRAPAGSR